MNEPKTHINVRLSPLQRQALRIYCAKKGTSAQNVLEKYVAELVKPELLRMEKEMSE